MESNTAEDDVVLATEEAVNADEVEKAVNTKTAQEIDYAEEAEDVEASEKDSATKIAEHAVVSVTLTIILMVKSLEIFIKNIQKENHELDHLRMMKSLEI